MQCVPQSVSRGGIHVLRRRVVMRCCGTSTAAAEKPSKKTAKLMSAWQIHEFGGTDQLKLSHSVKVPPLLGPKDVLIEVHAASVNPVDLQMLGGYGRGMFSMLRKVEEREVQGLAFPVTLGRDFSGVITQAGKGVTRLKAGDEVWGCTPPWVRNGHHSQFTVAPSTMVSKKPSSLSHIEAASVPYVAMTTWGALCVTGGLTATNTKGKRVLVYGGSGGIGTFAIQLLRAWDAEVTTTCSTDAVKLCETLGADHVIDYKTTDVKHELFKVKGFDFILDTLGRKAESFNLGLLESQKNAKYVTIVTPLLSNADNHGLLIGGIKSAMKLGRHFLEGQVISLLLDMFRLVQVGPHYTGKWFQGIAEKKHYRWGFVVPSSSALQTVASMMDKQRIIPFVEKTFSFDDVPCAFERVKAGHNRGKTVIDVISGSQREIPASERDTSTPDTHSQQKDDDTKGTPQS